MTLTPVFQACQPRPSQLTSSGYAADLQEALRNEIATPQTVPMTPHVQAPIAATGVIDQAQTQ